MSQKNSNSPQMLSIRGSTALSCFRLQKILANLSQSAHQINEVHADFWHFAWNEGELIPAQLDTLKKILT